MARKVIKTMADKMAESGKEGGVNVLDDTDLSTDPIVSALQTLRETIDDIQYNDTNHGANKLESTIAANTAKVGITTTQASRIASNSSKVGFSTEMPTATEGHTVQISVTNSRGAYSLVFTMVDASGRDKVTKTATIALR